MSTSVFPFQTSTGCAYYMVTVVCCSGQSECHFFLIIQAVCQPLLHYVPVGLFIVYVCIATVCTPYYVKKKNKTIKAQVRRCGLNLNLRLKHNVNAHSCR